MSGCTHTLACFLKFFLRVISSIFLLLQYITFVWELAWCKYVVFPFTFDITICTYSIGKYYFVCSFLVRCAATYAEHTSENWVLFLVFFLSLTRSLAFSSLQHCNYRKNEFIFIHKYFNVLLKLNSIYTCFLYSI